MRPTTLAALLCLAPFAATAAESAATRRIDVGQAATPGVIGRSGAPVRFAVRLDAESDHALIVTRIDPREEVNAFVYDPAGVEVLWAGAGRGGSPAGPLATPSSGVYTVEMRPVPGSVLPLDFAVAVVLDCADADATKCRLAPGARNRNRFAFAGDRDLFRVTLRADRTYVVRLDPSVPADLAIVEGESAPTSLAVGVPDRATRARKDLVIAGFRPPRTGTYFVLTYTTGAAGGPYRLSLEER